MSPSTSNSPFLGSLFGSKEIRSVFDARSTVRRYIDVEIALAQVQASIGIIPTESGEAISAALDVDRVDLETLGEGLERVGFPIVPLLDQLMPMVPEAHRKYVHWGVTTQDIMDTALVLQMREALGQIDQGLGSLRRVLALRADQHRSDIMIGRSQLQHAAPTTLGLKAATWLSMFQRHADRLNQLEERLYVVQLGGAVGTLAALGKDGEAVQRALAARLGLGVPSTPWHTARDSLAEAVTFLANVAASLGKLGKDIVLLAQSDVAEVRERAVPQRGVSSTMPQKRNPVSSQLLTVTASGMADLAGAILRASVHDHERASGNWMEEWRIIPDAFELTAGAVELGVDLVEGLQVDTARMRSNLERSEFIVAEAVMMALAPRLGKQYAHDVVTSVVQTAVSTGTSFRSALSNTPQVTESLAVEELEAALSPDNYLGATGAFIDRVLANEKQHSEGDSGE